MFGIGIFEILIIGLLILLFVQPKNLPGFFFKLGKFYRKASMSYQIVLREINLLRNKLDNWRQDINELMEMEQFAKKKVSLQKKKNSKNGITESKAEAKKNISNKNLKAVKKITNIEKKKPGENTASAIKKTKIKKATKN